MLKEVLDLQTVQDVLSWGRQRIAAAGCDNPWLDAELLLADVLGTDRGRLPVIGDKEIVRSDLEQFFQLIERRITREPVAYILGRKGFRYLQLKVDRRVLIPRPETELLVEVGLATTVGSRIVDVGTGSGAVPLALKHERPDLEVIGVDLSSDALTVAEENALTLGLSVQLSQSDLLNDVVGGMDVVLANLPYVTEDEYALLAPEITRHEPVSALVGGKDGLDLIRTLIVQVADRGVPLLAMEVGDGQAEIVSGLCRKAGFAAVHTRRDLAGIERVVVAELC